MKKLLILLVLGAACALGPRASRHPIAKGPDGSPIRITLQGQHPTYTQQLDGELLAVSDTGLWVLVDRHQLTFVPYSVVASAELRETGAPYYEGAAPPPKDLAERFRLESRFPQGLSPDLLRKILEAYGASSAVVVQP